MVRYSPQNENFQGRLNKLKETHAEQFPEGLPGVRQDPIPWRKRLYVRKSFARLALLCLGAVPYALYRWLFLSAVLGYDNIFEITEVRFAFGASIVFALSFLLAGTGSEKAHLNPWPGAFGVIIWLAVGAILGGTFAQYVVFGTAI